MKTSIHGEKDLREFNEDIPETWTLIHFKMVGVGRNTIKQAGNKGAALCDIVHKLPGFFLLSQDGSGLREAMHDLVDRFCDAQEGVEE